MRQVLVSHARTRVQQTNGEGEVLPDIADVDILAKTGEQVGKRIGDVRGDLRLVAASVRRWPARCDTDMGISRFNIVSRSWRAGVDGIVDSGGGRRAMDSPARQDCSVSATARFH